MTSSSSFMTGLDGGAEITAPEGGAENVAPDGGAENVAPDGGAEITGPDGRGAEIIDPLESKDIGAEAWAEAITP